MPSSFAKKTVDAWIKNLPLSGPQRSMINENFDKVSKWWTQEPEAAVDTVRTVAVMTGVPQP